MAAFLGLFYVSLSGTLFRVEEALGKNCGAAFAKEVVIPLLLLTGVVGWIMERLRRPRLAYNPSIHALEFSHINMVFCNDNKPPRHKK